MDISQLEPYTNKPIAELLQDATFFQALNPQQQDVFVDYIKPFFVPADTVLMKEREQNNILFFICEGSVNIYKQDKGQPRLLRTVPRQTFFGEWSFFDHQPCFADVITTTDSIILTLDRTNFLELSNQSPHCALAFALELFRSITGKLRQANLELFLQS